MYGTVALPRLIAERWTEVKVADEHTEISLG